MKKTLILIYLIVFFVLGACGNISAKEQPVRLTGADYIYNDFGNYSDEELQTRSTFEIERIYQDYLEDHPAKLEDMVCKYGIDDFWKHGDMFYFSDPEQMRIVLSDQNFIKDFAGWYSIPLAGEYLTLRGFSSDYLGIYLIVSDQSLHLNIHALSTVNGSTIFWNTYTAQQAALSDILEFYASLDELAIQQVLSADGTTVYYVAAENSTLMGAIGYLPSDKLYTAYFWQQDNVIGVLVLPGEYNEENLGLCVLEKHDI